MSDTLPDPVTAPFCEVRERKLLDRAAAALHRAAGCDRLDFLYMHHLAQASGALTLAGYPGLAASLIEAMHGNGRAAALLLDLVEALRGSLAEEAAA